MKASIFLILFLLSVSLAHPALADPAFDQMKQAIQQKVLHELKLNKDKQVDIIVGNLDSNFKLQPCAESPKIFLSTINKYSRVVTATLSCYGPKPWKLYVPVTIKTFSQVVVAKTNIEKGAKLNDTNTEIVQRDTQLLARDYSTDPQAVYAFVAKRSIRAGNVISTSLLISPKIIHKGQVVSIVVETSHLKVSMPGIAKEDGALNDAIDVINAKTKKIINGYVMNDHVVVVP